MPEFLVRVENKLADSPTKEVEVQRMHRGDVVVWRPDGWPWSVEELTNSFWRIIRAKLTNTEADALVSPELDIARVKSKLWKRISQYDLDLLPAGELKTWFEDDTRAVPIFDYKGSLGVIRSSIKVKPNADVYGAT